MKHILMACMMLALVIGLNSKNANAQDIATEVRQAWGNISIALEQLEIEVKILTQVETKLTKEYADLLQRIEDMQAEQMKTSVAPEPALTLLQNCLAELQRLRWEEATEKAVQEQFAADGEKANMTVEADLKIKELEGQAELLTQQFRAAEEQAAKFDLLYKKGSISSDVIEKNKAHIEELKTKLHSTYEAVALQRTIADTIRKQPQTESRNRLAQVVMRRQLLETELKELRSEHQLAANSKQKEWQITLFQKKAELLQEKLIPLQTRKMQVEALIEHYKEALKKPNE